MLLLLEVEDPVLVVGEEIHPVKVGGRELQAGGELGVDGLVDGQGTLEEREKGKSGSEGEHIGGGCLRSSGTLK